MNLIDYIRSMFGHSCKFEMYDMATHKMPEDVGVPLTAFIYRCKCGRKIYDLTNSGIRQLQDGVPYEDITKGITEKE